MSGANRTAEVLPSNDAIRQAQRILRSLSQAEAGKTLGVTQARVSDIKRGKISGFSLDLLVRLAARAGLDPTVRLAA